MTPTNTEHKDPQDTNELSSGDTRYPAHLTVGLRSKYDWALRNDALPALTLLFDAGLMEETPIALTHFMEEICEQRARTILSDWSEYLPEAKLMLSLVIAYDADSRDFALFGPDSKSEAGRSIYRKRLRTHYLASLASEHYPAGNEELTQWFTLLRLWVLMHGLMRAREGTIQDSHLREVATRLRIACELKGSWRALFNFSLSPFTDFHTINGHLLHIANIASKEKIPEFTLSGSVLDSFRRALKAVVLMEDGSEKVLEGDFKSLWDPGLLPRDFVNDPNSTSLHWSGADDDEGKGEVEWLPGTGEARPLGKIKVDETDTYFHQRLNSKNYFLSNTEELHYLPWMWDRINPFEQKLLNDWVTHALASDDPQNQTLASISWIALRSGRSFRVALDISIDGDLQDEWSLDLDSGELRRLPPRRQSAWEPDEEDKRWVTPLAEYIEIVLPKAILQIIQDRAKANPQATCLGELWAKNSESLFNKQMKGKLSRVTAGKLKHTLPQDAFFESHDPSYARMIANRPNIGVPGACAYTTWTDSAVNTSLNPQISNIYQLKDRLIGMGSLLDPIEELLQNSVNEATDFMASLPDNTDFFEYHNRYIAYITVCLWAATGIRPIKDSLESNEHINFSEQFIYVNDKVDREMHEGRLVPLPKSLCDYFSEEYPRYLRQVSTALETLNPALSEEILKISEGQSSGTMPYLFFLKQSPGVDWVSVSESGIRKLELFSFSLPYRLFRHRYTDQLRTMGVDPEIIEGCMGHGESGALTYSDYSPRCWQDDMDICRPAIEQAYRSLPFKIPKLRTLHTVSGEGVSTPDIRVTDRKFGIAARAENRIQTASRAIRSAMVEINAYLVVKLGAEVKHFDRLDQLDRLALLTEEQREALERQMLFFPNGKSRQNGRIRYDVLMKRVDSLWQTKNKKLKVRSRYMQFSPDQSPFDDKAPVARQAFEPIYEIWSQTLANIKPTRHSIKDCLAMAVMSLCIQNRITAKKILLDMMEGKCFRLITWQGKPYFEYSPHLEPIQKDKKGPSIALSKRMASFDRDIPVQRFRISMKVAALLDRVLGSKNHLDVRNHDISALVSNLPSSSIYPGNAENGISLDHFLDATLPYVRQVNAMTLPSVIAAYLDARFRSASLLWVDLSRLETGHSIQVLPSESDDDEGEYKADSIKDLAEQSIYHNIPPPNKEELIEVAHLFFNAIRACFPKSKGMEKSTTEHERRTIYRAMNRVLREYESQVSSAIHLLGQWAQALLYRKKFNNAYVAVRGTAYSYFSKLAGRFEDSAYNSDLFMLDSDALTDLYKEMLEGRKAKNRAEIAQRLKEFHFWARKQGIEDPGWSDLPDAGAAWLVSPGIITERDYQNALQLILNSTTANIDFGYKAALLLLFYYRYALRPGEALGLARKDVQFYEDGWVLLIRKNQYRDLKVPLPSQRQVPLVFKLSSLEKEILSYNRLNIESAMGDDMISPLFGDITSPRSIPLARELKKTITLALQHVTGNPDMCIYDARHTCANRLTLALNDLQLPGWENLSIGDSGADTPHDISMKLTGTSGTTRRNSWATGRFMGHGHPGTSHRSYIHILSSWADNLIDLPAERSRSKLESAINLDNFPRSAEVILTDQSLSRPTIKQPTTEKTLEFMHLIARGGNPYNIGSTLGFDIEFTEPLVHTLKSIGDKLIYPLQVQDGKAVNPDKNIDGLAFLRKISSNVWKVFQSNARNAEANKLYQSPIDIAELNPMVTKNRQIAAWNERQFSTISAFTDFFRISRTEYYLFYDTRTADTVKDTARCSGFLPIAPAETEDYKTFQLDNVQLNTDGDEKKNRCAFVIREGACSMQYSTADKHSISERVLTRNDVIALFIAFVAAHQTDVQQRKLH